MANQTHIPLPPEDLQSGVGRVPDADSYLDIGRVVKETLLERTGVQGTAGVLDIGCGSGRVARHFVDYVQPPGRYVGMDIMKAYVEWCQRNIAPVNPAFQFYHQDIYNGYYNPDGKYQGSEYSFPFEDESFDLIFLTSVFTHLLPDDALNYLEEISRLLAPGGRCFSTWFLLGHDIRTNHVSHDAYEERMEYGFRYCIEMIEQSGLGIVEEPTLGRWREIGGPLPQPLDQDHLILGRAADTETLASARYEAPSLGELDRPEPEEVRGTIHSFDPVYYAVTMQSQEGPRTFRLARDANIRVNQQESDSRALRGGQAVSIQLARESESDSNLAVFVRATEHLNVEQANGVIEFVDLELRLITLNYEEGFKTFELDPENTKVRVNGEVVSPGKLRKGQRASIRYVPSVRAIGFKESAPDG